MNYQTKERRKYQTSQFLFMLPMENKKHEKALSWMVHGYKEWKAWVDELNEKYPKPNMTILREKLKIMKFNTSDFDDSVAYCGHA